MATFTQRSHNRHWQAKIRCRGRKLSKTFRTKELAKHWAMKTEAAIRDGTYKDIRPAERTVLADAVQTYIDEVTPNLKSGVGEAQRLRKFIRDEPMAQIPMAELRTENFEAWRDKRLKEVRPGSVKRELSTLKRVVGHVRRRLNLSENVTDYVKPPKVNDMRNVRLNPEEEQRLLAAADSLRNPWVRPAVQLAVYTALRRGELLDMRWENVDLEKGFVWLEDTKNGESRQSSLTMAAVEVLKALGPKQEGHVLPLAAETLKMRFMQARKLAGLEHVRFHDLRHEGVSRLLEMGLSEHEVRKFSGHKDPKSFMRYVNLRAGEVSQKAWKLELRLREKQALEKQDERRPDSSERLEV